MTTTASSGMDSSKVLLLWSKPITENIKYSVTMHFLQMLELINYVNKNIQSTDRFVLIVPVDALQALVSDLIYTYGQVQRIYVVYENADDLKRYQDRIQDSHGRLQPCHERNLAALIGKLKVGYAGDPSRSNYRGTANDVATSYEQRLSTKRLSAIDRHSPEPKRFVSTFQHGFHVKNIEQFDSRYICPFCKLLFRKPWQLLCGHRICQSCIKTENNETTCLTCFQVLSNTHIWNDRGFYREMERLPVSCSSCDWTGSFELYQKHFDQKHPDTQNGAVIIDVYTQRINQNRLFEPVHTTETHQPIVSHIPSSSRTIHMPDNSNVHNNQYQFLLQHLPEVIHALANRVNIISNEQQRINNEVRHSQNLLQVVDQNFFSLRTSFEDMVSRARGVEIEQDLLAQEIWSLKQAAHDASLASMNGTYVWKIPGVREKLADAQSERQRSIYSSPFYSSPTGYKMCLRLYLNGDNDTRDTYLSVFLVIMRGPFDAILAWPFPYKVLFRLIDQSIPTDNERNHFRSFWPDIRSDCFQRPVYNRNEASGLREFLSVAEFRENQSRFVKDDTMFIEAKIDFLGDTPSISSTDGSPNDEEHVGPINEDFTYLS